MRGDTSGGHPCHGHPHPLHRSDVVTPYPRGVGVYEVYPRPRKGPGPGPRVRTRPGRSSTTQWPTAVTPGPGWEPLVATTKRVPTTGDTRNDSGCSGTLRDGAGPDPFGQDPGDRHGREPGPEGSVSPRTVAPGGTGRQVRSRPSGTTWLTGPAHRRCPTPSLTTTTGSRAERKPVASRWTLVDGLWDSGRGVVSPRLSGTGG